MMVPPVVGEPGYPTHACEPPVAPVAAPVCQQHSAWGK